MVNHWMKHVERIQDAQGKQVSTIKAKDARPDLREAYEKLYKKQQELILVLRAVVFDEEFEKTYNSALADPDVVKAMSDLFPKNNNKVLK